MRGWTFDPLIVALLGGAAAAYVRGVRRMARRPSMWAMSAAAVTAAALIAALLSPIEALAERRLWAHMVQHLLLLIVAAPLLAAAAPGIPLLVGLPGALRRALRDARGSPPVRRARAILTRPLVAWGVAAAVLWAWHAPTLYGAALDVPLLHATEHATMLGSAWLFWWTAFGRSGRLGRGPDVVYVLTGGFQAGALGALLAFSTTPIYAPYLETATAGLTALQDQQLAGAIMWIPMGLVTLGVACAMFVWWVASEAGSPAPSPYRTAEARTR